jgi:tRNA threonylcarbamoyladenosine biosynthesis protein TsaE
MNHTLFLADEESTVAFGQRLAEACAGKALITLSGNLGTGKTTLTRGIIRAFGHQGAVKSPTYTLVEPYDLCGFNIFHFDLYRLEDPEELEFIGFWDYLEEDALIIIEWPEKAGHVLPPVDLALTLRIQDKGREISWTAHTGRGEQFAHRLNG